MNKASLDHVEKVENDNGTNILQLLLPDLYQINIF